MQFFISIFFFLVFKHDFMRYALILPASQLQTQQVMTSQIRSHIEYLIQSIIFLCSFCSRNWWKI